MQPSAFRIIRMIEADNVSPPKIRAMAMKSVLKLSENNACRLSKCKSDGVARDIVDTCIRKSSSLVEISSSQ